MAATDYHDPDRLAYIEHGGRVDKSREAACYRINGQRMWIPLSLLRDADSRYIAIPLWFAAKKKLRSAW